jgi:hypothetical protein
MIVVIDQLIGSDRETRWRVRPVGQSAQVSSLAGPSLSFFISFLFFAFSFCLVCLDGLLN